MKIEKLKKVTKKEEKPKKKKLTQRQLIEEKIKFLEENDPSNKEIEELKKSLVRSKRGRASKSKGSTYERTVASIFKDKLDIELVRTPQSGGFAKSSEKAGDYRGDIVCLEDNVDFKLSVEVKNQKTWSLPSWIRQAEDDTPEGKIPLVVYHRNQKNKDGKRIQEAGDYVTLSLEDFLDIVDKNKIIKEV